MYCLSIDSSHLETIKSFNYIPVGLGEDLFSKEWIRDSEGKNISNKNKHYGEYTCLLYTSPSPRDRG